jgi:hypothetical protein
MRRIKAPIALSVRIDALILIDARNIFMGRPSLRVRAGGGGEGGRVESIFNLSRVVAPLINGADSFPGWESCTFPGTRVRARSSAKLVQS